MSRAKEIRGHRLRFRDKACDFENLAHVIQGLIVKNIECES